MYQRKIDVDMLNAVKSMLADVSNVSPLCSDEGLTLETSANTLFTYPHQPYVDTLYVVLLNSLCIEFVKLFVV